MGPLSDRRDGSYIEYSGEEQAICAVGLAKPKPGVFIEAIQYLLVLATPVEVSWHAGWDRLAWVPGVHWLRPIS